MAISTLVGPFMLQAGARSTFDRSIHGPISLCCSRTDWLHEHTTGNSLQQGILPVIHSPPLREGEDGDGNERGRKEGTREEPARNGEGGGMRDEGG